MPALQVWCFSPHWMQVKRSSILKELCYVMAPVILCINTAPSYECSWWQCTACSTSDAWQEQARNIGSSLMLNQMTGLSSSMLSSGKSPLWFGPKSFPVLSEEAKRLNLGPSAFKAGILPLSWLPVGQGTIAMWLTISIWSTMHQHCFAVVHRWSPMLQDTLNMNIIHCKGAWISDKTVMWICFLFRKLQAYKQETVQGCTDGLWCQRPAKEDT